MSTPRISVLRVNLGTVRNLPHRSHAVPMLQVFAITVMVFPSDTVIKAVGAAGYAAGLVGMLLFASYIAATVLGFHNPLQTRHPIRGVLCVLWLVALISYITMDRRVLTPVGVQSADRFIMQLAVISGVALVAAECLTSMHEVKRVLRALCWGGAFCGVIAALQFWISLDLTPYLRMLPGFSMNGVTDGIMTRAALNRVSGTAIHPIELGVTAGMLLPLAIFMALYDREQSKRRRWIIVALIGLNTPASVSRSAILSLVLAITLMIVLMPSRQRVTALALSPIAVVGVFMTAPGLISTLTSFFSAGTSDASISTRVDDYPMVERLVGEAPWFGHGGGTYLPDNMIDILDNQYLKTMIELGLVGFAALALYFFVPIGAALVARRKSGEPELKLFCAALAGSALAGAVCSFTFDSLSFPMLANVQAIVIGLVGACCRLAMMEASVPAAAHYAPPLSLVAPGVPGLAVRTTRPAGG